MAHFVYIGDPRDHARLTTRDEKGKKLAKTKREFVPEHDEPGRETTVAGHVFQLRGDPVEVTDERTVEKLRGNQHFEEVKPKRKPKAKAKAKAKPKPKAKAKKK